jgi:ABC-type multidrug transport system fused ATPase/permease subunit
MQRLLFNVISQGTSKDHFDPDNQRIIYTNIIYVSLPIVYLIFIAIDFKDYLVPVTSLKWDQFIFLVEIAVCGAGLYLNKVGHSVIGRLIFTLTWPFLFHLIPIWHLQTPSDYYVAYPLGIIFHSVLIQMLFSIRHERMLYVFLMSVNFIMLLTATAVLRYFDDSKDGLYDLTADKYYFLDIVLYWLLFSLLSYLLVNSVDKLIDKLTKANTLIAEQKEEMATINEELSETNQSLQVVNQKMANLNDALEMKVQERTEEIEQRNEKLESYAFYNAHKLRGPYCRILGLISLRKIVEVEERQEIDRLLDTCMLELEQVIREIQEIVDQPIN